jgi:hypothetical protein
MLELIQRGQDSGYIDATLPPAWLTAGLALGRGAGEAVKAGRMTIEESTQAMHQQLPPPAGRGRSCGARAVIRPSGPQTPRSLGRSSGGPRGPRSVLKKIPPNAPWFVPSLMVAGFLAGALRVVVAAGMAFG